MSEIEKQEPESILNPSTGSRYRNGKEDMIEESVTSSNSDEYMDEEDGEDSEESDSDSDDSSSSDEDEEADDEGEEMMDQDDGPSTSSGHNTRSSSRNSPTKGNSDKKNSTNGKTKKQKSKKDSESAPEDADSMSEVTPMPTTYVPTEGDGVGPEDLEYDESAYIMYHKAECGYPCLSFDIIPDGLGTGETRSSTYPQSVYLVAGTQAPKVHANKLLVMKMSNLHQQKNKKKETEEDSEESDDEADREADPSEEPQLLAAQVPHDGSVNRVRVVKLGNKTVAATWSELGHVFLWDLTKQLAVVEESKLTETFNKAKAPPKHFFKFSGHKVEGYSLDWSPMAEGFLATGDCNKNIHIWRPQESFTWKVDSSPLLGHTSSVEDIQWSPTESTVLASCSVDKSIRIWDIRSKPSAACMITAKDAHSSDINVISWNKKDATFLLSGGDDGAIKTWDLRMFASCTKKSASAPSPTPIATFKHHVQPVTSIEWHPTDSTVFAASSDDNQITLWDLAVEKDDEEEDDLVKRCPDGSISGTSSKENDSMEEARLKELPPQLLFIHQGQNEVKEVHWHPQIDGLVISTALSGFDIFRTVSV